jgi:hypothetical protein
MTNNTNKFFDIFNKFKLTSDVKTETAILKNTQGIGNHNEDRIQQEINSILGSSENDLAYGGHATQTFDPKPLLESKKGKIAQYREMYLYPEINEATENVVNDAIATDDEGEVARLVINKKYENDINDNIKKQYRSVFQYMIEEVFNFNKTAEDLFTKWLIEGELYLELVLNMKKNNIVGFNVLPAYSMIPIYSKSNTINRFIQCDNIANTNDISKYIEDKTIEFSPLQVAYANYGHYGKNKYDIRGYYEPSIRTYHHLKATEDAIVVYRLVRAPERRVWNVYTGKMSKSKAQGYLNKVMNKYTKKNIYNSSTGQVDQKANIQSVSDDIWFPKDENGNGTTVDSIGGGMNLGEIDDIKYFLNKLYKALKIPSSRWNTEEKGDYNAGRLGEVSRDEIKFARFIEKLQRNFSGILTQTFITLLKMNGVDEKYINTAYFDINFNQTNLWKDWLEQEKKENNFNMYSNATDYIWNPRDNQGGWMSNDFAVKEYLKFTDEEVELNNEMLAEEKARWEKEKPKNFDEEEE